MVLQSNLINLRVWFLLFLLLGIVSIACTTQPQQVSPRVTPRVQNNPVPQKTSTPSPTRDTGLQGPYKGIWISASELAALSTSGPAWQQLKAVADEPPTQPDISDQDQMNDVYVLAKALVYARTGERKYRDEVIEIIMAAIGTEDGGRTLALGRNLVSYIIAADLINLPADSDKDMTFRAWLRHTLADPLEGETLQSTHEGRANNWGTHAGASRAALAIYLEDNIDLERTAQVFKGWLGDRDAYGDFDYGNLSWQCDPDHPVGINPKGCIKDGISIGGALPEEMRRGGSLRWPPKETGYPWEALQGALVQAEILHRAGYPTWEWSDQALLRAVRFLYDLGWEAEGDDLWQPWLINHAYGTNFPATTPARPGKNMGWTDWTHKPLPTDSPAITTFTPSLGSAGTDVIINGNNFIDVIKITFNGVQVSGFTILSDRQIQVSVPSGATSGPISITNSLGSDTSRDNFAVIDHE